MPGAPQDGADPGRARRLGAHERVQEVEAEDRTPPREAARDPAGGGAGGHTQVIAAGEVEPGRRAAADRAAAVVERDGVADAEAGEACRARAQAEVEVLEREEVRLVEQRSEERRVGKECRL